MVSEKSHADRLFLGSTPELLQMLKSTGEQYFPSSRFRLRADPDLSTMGYRVAVLHMPTQASVMKLFDFNVVNGKYDLRALIQREYEHMQRQLEQYVFTHHQPHGAALYPLPSIMLGLQSDLHWFRLGDEIIALLELMDVQLISFERPPRAERALYLVKSKQWAEPAPLNLLYHGLTEWSYHLSAIAARHAT